MLAAEPPAFCAGGSLDELLEPVATLPEIYEGMLALAHAPVPTIAAVGGAAIGAGVNLPLFCDVIVASPSARFDPRWLDVGIHPGGGHLFRLADRVGRQAAAALVLCGEVLDGERAADLGLAWRCVPDDELLPTAIALAERAAGRDGELVRRTKASLDASLAAGAAARCAGGRARGAGVVDGPPRVPRHPRAPQAALTRRCSACGFIYSTGEDARRIATTRGERITGGRWRLRLRPRRRRTARRRGRSRPARPCR